MKIQMFAAAMVFAVGAMAQDPPPAQPQDKPAQAAKDNKDTKMQGAQNSSSMPAEMKTQTYKGVLVDMSCAGASAATPAATSTGQSANPNPNPNTNPNPNQSQSSADRTGTTPGGTSGSSCPVSASSTQLGLKMKDGKTVPFDLVGNQRAQDALKNNKKWSEAASSGKEIRATISGAMSGEKLIVSSIH